MISWTSRDGRTLTAGVEIDGFWWSKIDGEEAGSGLGPSRDIPAAAQALGVIARVGKVALRAEQLTALEAEAREQQASFRASPEGLRAQRRGLLDDLAGRLDEARIARERWHADEGGCARAIPPVETADVSNARAALARFLRAHPEVSGG